MAVLLCTCFSSVSNSDGSYEESSYVCLATGSPGEQLRLPSSWLTSKAPSPTSASTGCMNVGFCHLPALSAQDRNPARSLCLVRYPHRHMPALCRQTYRSRRSRRSHHSHSRSCLHPCRILPSLPSVASYHCILHSCPSLAGASFRNHHRRNRRRNRRRILHHRSRRRILRRHRSHRRHDHPHPCPCPCPCPYCLSTAACGSAVVELSAALPVSLQPFFPRSRGGAARSPSLTRQELRRRQTRTLWVAGSEGRT
mmetsp:Transcript_9971/g.16631  ORF Transcript_9971/g.16631 Transcript_9971/m.16631 type:complete len:254 (+) Transcript_9971:263-1024(+)